MLPKINDVPQYRLTIPSTGEEVSFRPFLVKEQKVLLVAIESQDETQIIDSIINTIKSCAPDINHNKLATFDLEYVFTKIRSKSVGETSNIQMNCQECETPNEIQVNLDSVEVDMQDRSNTIVLNDQYTIDMKYPHYDYMRDNGQIKEVQTATDVILELVMECLDSVNTEEERVSFSDYTKEEIVSFVESLTSDQFALLVDWATNLPKLAHTAEFDCVQCGHKNTQALEGLQNFFS